MSKVEEIQSAIESLDVEEYVELRGWFDKKNWEEWDKKKLATKDTKKH